MMATLVAMLTGCGMAGRTAKQEAGGNGSSRMGQTNQTNAGDAEKEETKESQAVSYKERADIDPDKCLDENGNPTIYALWSSPTMSRGIGVR